MDQVFVTAEGKYQSTKTFDNYSVALRQWKAQHSHCQLLHGYAFIFKVWFEPVDTNNGNGGLDDMNWVVDFGGFKDTPIGNGLKAWMDYMFDHTLLIEKDDPYLDLFQSMNPEICHLRVIDKMGAENLAKLVYNKFNEVLSKTDGARCKVVMVECFENNKNSAIYKEK
jgi:6-pyruvoyltetrahydropterin/6-carboxytetrahydropterin synthase